MIDFPSSNIDTDLKEDINQKKEKNNTALQERLFDQLISMLKGHNHNILQNILGKNYIFIKLTDIIANKTGSPYLSEEKFKKIKFLVEEGNVNLNCFCELINQHKTTPLLIAIKCKNIKLAKFFILHGADLDIRGFIKSPNDSALDYPEIRRILENQDDNKQEALNKLIQATNLLPDIAKLIIEYNKYYFRKKDIEDL